MDDEAEVRLRELPIAFLEEVAGVGGDAVAGYWHGIEMVSFP